MTVELTIRVKRDADDRETAESIMAPARGYLVEALELTEGALVPDGLVRKLEAAVDQIDRAADIFAEFSDEWRKGLHRQSKLIADLEARR